MADGEPIWVCAVCHSVNKIGAKQCYKCRTPKEHAAYDPTTEDISSRKITLPDFHPSRPAAMLATVLILVTGVLHTINSLNGIQIVLRIVNGDLFSDEELIGFGVVGLASFGIALIALTGWAFWLSKAVRTMPALGLGYPAANGLMAFYENFIPLLNLRRVPAIVRDLVQRLEPGDSRGSYLISAAWIGLFTGYLLPRFGGFVNDIGSETLEGYVRNLVILQILSLLLVLTGSVLLVMLIWWVEGRILRRQTALSEAGPEGLPPIATAAGKAAAPGGVAWAVGGPATNFETTAPIVNTPPPIVNTPAPVVNTVPGPLGAVAVGNAPDAMFNRPITALTGTAGPMAATPAHSGADPLEGYVPASDEPAALPFAPQPAAAPEAAATPASGGPRLELAIAADGSMIATLDGESEPITIKEVREAAKVLARVDGSAAVSVGDVTPAATSMAAQALQILADAGVPATSEHRPD
jgi:hypothetical protein